MRGRARPFSVILALLVVILGLGIGGNAWADSGNGRGPSSDSAPPGQAKASDGNAFGTPAGVGLANGTSSQGADSTEGPGTSDGTHGNSDPGASNQANGSTSQAADSQARVTPADTTVSPDTTALATDSTGPGSSDHSQGNASTQGSPDATQPLSNADQNSGGANGQCPGGPYCSTRDGSPSLNGNGNGHAYGKPCAGCVGKADNKNPKGQYPNGKQDGNNGYECDGNNGIGKTNPAHTGCTGTTPPTDCHTDNSCPKPPCTQTNSCPPPPGCQSDCTPPGCQSDCTPPGCQSDCTPPGCQSDCTPPGCQTNCVTTCPQGQVMSDSGSCSCPANMSEDSNGGCYEVGTPVYVCPSGMVMHSNGSCHCPKGDTMINGTCTAPEVKGIQKFRPRPNTQVTTPQLTTPQVAPAAAGLPNTGADEGLGIYAMTGATLLLAGGALMLLRRKAVRR